MGSQRAKPQVKNQLLRIALKFMARVLRFVSHVARKQPDDSELPRLLRRFWKEGSKKMTRGLKVLYDSSIVKLREIMGLDLRVTVSDRNEWDEDFQPKARAVRWRLRHRFVTFDISNGNRH